MPLIRRSALVLFSLLLGLLCASTAGAAIQLGAAQSFPLVAAANPSGIAAGPDGNLWAAETALDQIVRITPDWHANGLWRHDPGSGTRRDCRRGGRKSLVHGVGSQRDRSDHAGWRVPEFTTGLTATPNQIAAGSDGNLWFTETVGNRIGRITPAGVVLEFSAE